MGWGISAQARRELLERTGSLVSDASEFEPDVIILDANTQIRFAAAGDRDLCARFVADNFVSNAFGGRDNPQDKTLVILFDNKARMHVVRKHVQRARLNILTPEMQEKAVLAGKTIVCDRAFKPGTEPYDEATLCSAMETLDLEAPFRWNRLLNCSKGKHLAFSLLVKAIKRNVQGKIRPDGFRVLLWYAEDEPYMFPNNWPLDLVSAVTNNRYGEADERVLEAVFAFQTFFSAKDLNILVKTIDTDMLIQLLVAPIENRGRIFVTFKNETVDALCWRNFFGACDNDRASRALLFTFASGCDYNAGLAQFGYLNKTLIDAATASSVPECVRIDRDMDTCAVDIGVLASIIKTLPRRNKRKKPIEFTSELENAAFTVAYFSGCKKLKGGPDLASAESTVTQKSKDDRTSQFRAFLNLANHPVEPLLF